MSLPSPSTLPFAHVDQIDKPTYTAAQMKVNMDAGVNYLSSWHTTTFLPALLDSTTGNSGADNIGFSPTYTGGPDTVQGAVAELYTDPLVIFKPTATKGSMIYQASSTGIVDWEVLAPVTGFLNASSTGLLTYSAITDGNVTVTGTTAYGTLLSTALAAIATALSTLDASKITKPANSTDGDLIYYSTAGTWTRLPRGTTGQVLTISASTLPAWAAATGGDGLSEWNTVSSTFALVDSTSFSCIYDTTTANYFKPGRPLRFSTGGITYRYNLVTALTTAGVVTVAGAPLDANYATVTYGDITRVVPLTIMIPSRWSTGASTTLINSLLKTNILWRQGPAYCAQLGAIVDVDDSGANQPRVNCTIAGNYLSTANSTAGLQIAETWGYLNTAINVSNYDIAYGEEIELTTDANGTNDDSTDLTVDLVFVLQ